MEHMALNSQQNYEQKAKNLKILQVWAEDFLEDSFNTVYNNIECFTIKDFRETSLFFAIEGLVCQELCKAESGKFGFGRNVENERQNPTFVIEAESHLRQMFDNTVDSILTEKLVKIKDKKQIPDTLLAGTVCKDMLSFACDNIFGGEKQKMAEEFEAKNGSKKPKPVPCKTQAKEQTFDIFGC